MVASSVLLLLALLALWYALRLRRHTGLPWAHVAASDTGGGQPLQQPLFSRRYGISGKPDYLLQRRGALIPVEVKPNRSAAQPYDSDLMQLAAYCLLVEEQAGSAPPYGLLCYAQATFRLDYTASVRRHLLDVVGAMREVLDDEEECSRSHNDARRCGGCGFVTQCEEALVERAGGMW
jgi:CRISPR-associated exonuclease Cas4